MKLVAGKVMVFFANEDLKDKFMQHLVTLIKVLFLVLLISACSKRTVDLEAIDHNVKLNTSLDSSTKLQVKSSNQVKAFQFSDEQSDYQVTIKPKGPFKFNAAGGFEGEAESITINGKSNKTAAAGQTVSGTKDSSAVTDLKKKSEFQEEVKTEAKKTEAKRTNGLSSIFIWLIIGFLLWGAIKIYRQN